MNQYRTTIQSPASVAGAATRSLGVSAGLVVLFAGLTFLGANIVIPLEPVPVTLQTLFVLLAGAAIGAGRGAVSQALYTGAGALGLPIYAGGLSGLAVLAGPTGGYIASFVVAPILVGALIHRSERIAWQTGVFTLATVVIFAFGVTHLALFYTHDTAAALQLGLVPFLPGAVFKIVAAVSIHRSLSSLRRRAANRSS